MRRELLILSGKGGTGKSTVAVNMALALAKQGKAVGLLDCDLTTPNVPKMLNMGKTKLVADQVIDPVRISSNLKVMSIGFDAHEQQGIVWDGGRIRNIVSELISGVGWGKLDYLIVDMPPGSSDDLIETIKDLPNAYAVVVMIPSVTAKMDAAKLLNVLRLKQVNVAGVIENMTGFFGNGLGVELAKEFKVKFLGAIPADPDIPKAMAEGKNILQDSDEFNNILNSVIKEVCE